MTEKTIRELAQDMAQNSIVTTCLTRYIEQIIEFIYEDMIAPRDKRIAELEAKLRAHG